MNRLYNLDYLRGLAAFGIMIYHYLAWTIGDFSADTFMGRIGIYGVSIFYILSGLTLYYVYFNKMRLSKEDIFGFIKKRIFRIFPLLWLVTIVAIVLSRKIPDLFNLFLNLTGFFGFLKWDEYFSAGVWSIGNELVFYVFFPFFVFFTKFYKNLMIILSILLFALYLYFAFFILTDTITLNEQWRNYVNPLNQVFLFLGGFLIGLFLYNIRIKTQFNIAVLIAGIVLFVFYPVDGNTINLVTGANRLIFTLSCLLICISFYKLTIQLPTVIHTPLTLLGEASYSVYLLHPIIYKSFGIFSKNILHFPESVRLILSVVSTLIISYYVYQYFEKYFMKLGGIKKTTSPNIGDRCSAFPKDKID